MNQVKPNSPSFLNKRKNNTQKILGTAIFSVAILLIAALLYLNVIYKNRDKINKITLCPEEGPVAELAILIDTTDHLSEIQKNKIILILEQIIKETTNGTKMTLGLVISSTKMNQQTYISLCKPEDGTAASQLYQNPKLIVDTFEKNFKKPVTDVLDGMLSTESSDTSPIMESIQAIITKAFSLDTPSIPRSLFIFSDMLQNSDSFSFYRNDNWQKFLKSPHYLSLSRNLNNVKIIIYKIPNIRDSKISQNLVNEFWINYFEQQGVQKITSKLTIGEL